MSTNAITMKSLAGVSVLLLLGARPLTCLASIARQTTSSPDSKQVTFIRAFVVDERLSVLRREPNLHSEAIRRLRLGHAVFIIQPKEIRGAFCRIAVSRRTRGWIYRSALAVPGRMNDDDTVMKLIESTRDGFDRIMLCQILIKNFSRSKLVPKALMSMGEEAERAAETLSQRAHRRRSEPAENVGITEYYLNDPGLDRYSRLHIFFDFNEPASEYVYNGQAYLEIVKRYPHAVEAVAAMQHLAITKEKRTGQH